MEIGPLKRGLTAAPGMMASTPVAAEVCDKVRPAWNPQDGAVTQIEDLALFIVEPLGVIALVLAVAAVLLRKTWFTGFAVIMMLIIITMNISTWRKADDVTTFAVSEGCITAPVLTTIALTFVAAIISVITWRSSIDKSQVP